MDTNYAPLLADLFLYSYETDFIQGFLKNNKKKKQKKQNKKKLAHPLFSRSAI
jgi:hypothetical protein